MLYIDPDREFVAAKFSSQPELASVKNALEQIHAIEAIADVLGDGWECRRLTVSLMM